MKSFIVPITIGVKDHTALMKGIYPRSSEEEHIPHMDGVGISKFSEGTYLAT